MSLKKKNKPFNNRCGEAERLLNLVSNIVNIHKNLTPNKEELDSLEKHLNRASGILDKLEQELNDGDVDS